MSWANDPAVVRPEGDRPPAHEPIRWSWIRRLTQGERMRRLAPGDRTVLIDIGANIGRACIPPVSRGDVRRALAAEPDPENVRCLRENIAAASLAEVITADGIAISDYDGTATLTRSTRPTDHRLQHRPPRKPHETVTVPTRRLDTWIDSHGVAPSSVALVKIDVQGWEPYVLKGATGLLQDPGVLWMLEVCPRQLRTAGTTPQDFYTTLRQTFSRVMDLRGEYGWRSTDTLAELLDVLDTDEHRAYANLLLAK